MQISKRNPGLRARYVPRVNAPAAGLWGYRFRSGEGPALTYQVDGVDGNGYEIVLSQADIEAIVSSRIRHQAEFFKHLGK